MSMDSINFDGVKMLLRQSCEAVGVGVDDIVFTPGENKSYQMSITLRSGEDTKLGVVGFQPDKMPIETLQAKVKRFASVWSSEVIL